MACQSICPIFVNSFASGIKQTAPLPDGYSVYCNWETAIPSTSNTLVGYNVYYSTNKDNVFKDGAKLFTTKDGLVIGGFVPGDVVYFGLKATEYIPTENNLQLLANNPLSPNAKLYPTTLLASNINDNQLTIPVIDAMGFPGIGLLQVGSEIIKYTNIDFVTNVITGTERGYYNTNPTIHNIDGYDGYKINNPEIRVFSGFQDPNEVVSQVNVKFSPPNFPYTLQDGYRQNTKDIITTDLTASDNYNMNFPSYDYSGYHQTNIIDYFSGHCIGSYAGGEYGCADGYKLRGLNVQEENNKRLEMMLDVDGEPTILLRKLWTGIKCNCTRTDQERPDGRCPICFNTSFVGGYEQFYYPRSVDGKFKVRYQPAADDISIKPAGWQENFTPNCWTLVIPAIKTRDILIRFNQDMQEEYRYEVVNVTRNKMQFSLLGAQQLQVYRLDKTDIVYQWRANKNLGNQPAKYNTTISSMASYGPHMHTLFAPHSATQVTQINSTTTISAGHSHPIINGRIQSVLNHTHDIIFI